MGSCTKAHTLRSESGVSCAPFFLYDRQALTYLANSLQTDTHTHRSHDIDEVK